MKREPKKHNIWPWPIPYFLPKCEKSKVRVFRFADITLPDEERTRFQVVAARATGETRVAAKAKTGARIESAAKAELLSQPSNETDPDRPLSGLGLELVVRSVHPGVSASPPATAESDESHATPRPEFEAISVGSNAELALLGTLQDADWASVQAPPGAANEGQADHEKQKPPFRVQTDPLSHSLQLRKRQAGRIQQGPSRASICNGRILVIDREAGVINDG